jgi:hypothetical protein
MKIRKIVTFVSILSFTIISLTIKYPLKAINFPTIPHVKARASDNFVESMGISTKFGFCPGRLCDNYPEVKTLLAELGIRYIRDIPYPEAWRRRTDLYEDHGIRMLAETGRIWGEPLNLANISAQLDAIKLWGEMVVGIVGVNEYDNAVYHSCEETEGCDPNWSEKSWSKNYLQFQQRLYQQVKADKELDHLPVVMGPMAHLDNLERLENMNSFCDRGNDHSYPGAWGKPSQESGGGTIDSVRSMGEVVVKVHKACSGKQLWITETGYEEAETIHGQQNQYKYLVTSKAKAKYLPRIYANYYLQDQIEKTFLFELLNATLPGTAFGIIDTDLQPTPAYYGIKNMISLLGEASWNDQTQSWKHPAFKPNFLKYTLEGDNRNLKHLLLQKSNETFYLLLWQEVYVYDSQQGRDIVNPNRPIKLKLEGEIIEKANKYLLYNENNPDAELVPLKTWTDVSSLSLSVPDHILVLEFSLKDKD